MIAALPSSYSELPWQVGGRTNLKAIPPREQLRYTERWSKAGMDALRLQGDPIADDVASELHSKHGGLTNIYDLLNTVRAKAEEPGECGQIFREFLEVSVTIPDWADRAKIERGQRVWAVHLPLSGLSGLCGALVGGSQFATAAVVTALAGNMSTRPTRRLNETGLLLGAMAFPGSLFEPGSQAHDSLTRVRLLHGALRHWLPRSGRLAAHQSLVPETVYVPGEVPVNQEDLAIALGLVGYLNLRNLRRLDVVLSAYDTDCYIQMWRYAGYVLGISEELLPASLEEQEEFVLCAMLHQAVPEWVPATVLKKFISEFAKATNKRSHGILSYSVVSTFLKQMTMYLNGDDYTSGLQLENLGSRHWSIRLARSFGFVFGTLLPRAPLGEAALFHWNTFRLWRDLLKRTPVGQAAGSGSFDEPPEQEGARSKL